MEEEQVKDLIQQMIDIDNQVNQFAVAKTPFHTHNGSDSISLDYTLMKNRTRYILYRVVLNTSDVAVTTKVGGDLSMPFGGYFESVGYTVDTAGVTGTMTANFLVNGVARISDVSISTATKTSRNNVQQTFTKNTFDKGDIVTFNVTAIQTTAAKGLTFFLKVVETTP